MKKNILIGLLMAVAFVAVVATGVHILHKKAYAMVQYTVFVTDIELQPLNGLSLETSFWLDGQGNWGDWNEMENNGEWDGWYWFDREQGYATHWRVRLNDARPLNPLDNPYQPPDTNNSFQWIVEIIDP